MNMLVTTNLNISESGEALTLLAAWKDLKWHSVGASENRWDLSARDTVKTCLTRNLCCW
jgi:hypothetical protein